MSLFSKPFAFDTETDDVGEEEPRTVLIQMCPVDATSEQDVVVLEGVDVFEQFLDRVEDTKHNMTCHSFNLDYEWSRLENIVLKRYTWAEKKLERGTFHVVADDKSVYELKIMNQHGKVFTMTDDWQRSKGEMKKVAADIYSEHPEWWPSYITSDDVKMDVGEDKYNNGWFNPEHPDHDLMMLYAIRDAFSQAMIARFQIESGRANYLTGSSAGLGTCLIGKYDKNKYNTSHYKKLKWAKDAFRKQYPPLSREMQDIVEESLVGGFVYGDPGRHRGCFTHADYKSSYPKHYQGEDSFIGTISRITPDSPRYGIVQANDKMFRWYLVSFEFDGITDVGMPVITGKECWFPDGKRPPNCWNHKMRKGVVKNKLMTEAYWEELQKHINITNYVIHEMWFAKKVNGAYREFIEEEYFLKEVCKAGGMKAESKIHKDNMNGGVHGKTITKTHRKSLTYANGKREFVEVVNDPEYCALIGFTGMMNRRCKLLHDCRMVQENGGRVLMCDTDSMVTDMTEEQLRALFEREIADEEVCDGKTVKQKVKELMDSGMEWECVVNEMRQYKRAICDELGKFELEMDSVGIVEFDGFDCWGLKRYLETNKGEFRKSAFAGMSEKAKCDWSDKKGQKILMDAPMDGELFTWTQNGSKRGNYGKMIRAGMKSARMEDIWYRPIEETPKKKGVTLMDKMNEIEYVDMMNDDAYWGECDGC